MTPNFATKGGGLKTVVKMTILPQKLKNEFFKTYSLQGKLKIRAVGRKQKIAQKMLKFAKVERSISDEWRVQ